MFFGCSVCLSPIAWLIFVLAHVPSHQAPDQTIPRDCEIYSAFYVAYSKAFVRIEIMQAKNQDIYLPKHNFLEVSFSDRKETIKRIGKPWGRFTGWYYFSSLQF